MTDARRLSARLQDASYAAPTQDLALLLSDAARLAELVENYAAARSHGTTYHLLGDGRLAVEYKNPDVHPAESALLTCDLIGREGVDG